MGKVHWMVIDDQDLSQEFPTHFVHVPSFFQEREVEKALQILRIAETKEKPKTNQKRSHRNGSKQ